MEGFILEVEPRPLGTKSSLKTMRREGFIPGVCYGKGFDSKPVKISTSSIQEVLKRKKVAGSTLLRCSSKQDANLEGLKVLLKQLAWDPIGKCLLNVVLHVVRMDETIETAVPIRTVGESIGVKEQSGVLELMKHSLVIECLPEDIPEAIEVDVSGLRVGDVVHVSDLPLSPSLSIKDDPEEAVVTLAAPMREEEAVEASEGEVLPEEAETK
jgi:large subunit ribosomal protein L25